MEKRHMKRIITLLGTTLLGLMLLTGCNQQQEPGVTIGVVDEAAAFQNNKVASQAMEYLKQLGEPMQAKAEAAYNAMQEDQTEENVAAYKKAMGELQQSMQGEQQRVVALVDAKFREALETYRKDNGLTVILSKGSVLSSGETVDITADIVAAMDAMTVDFELPKQPEAAPEAAPETEGEQAQ
tara:strand:- start:25461 stop:26009 length:549 start_codon:yes stop_codon:yes gene_type:complete